MTALPSNPSGARPAGFAAGLWFPAYRPVAAGPWSIAVVTLAAARGYWGESYPLGETAILRGPGRNGAASWMSMTPSEIESQTIGLAAAHGHTVVLGLGMGWLAANAALKPEVDRVTVIEQDADIIALIRTLGIFDQLPPDIAAKIEIIPGDALSWRPESPVDTLQADIWERFVEDNKISDVQRMRDNIDPAAIYFWGQEMELWREARNTGTTLDWPALRAIAANRWALPLIFPDWPDYPEKIAAAAEWWAPSP